MLRTIVHMLYCTYVVLYICFNLYDRIVETFLFMNIYGRFVKGIDEFAEQFSEEWPIKMISHAIDFVTQY